MGRGGFLKFFRKKKEDEKSLVVRYQFQLFQQILTLNDRVLSILAEIEEKAQGKKPVAVEEVVKGIREAGMDVFIMVKNLNIMTEGAHSSLFSALKKVNQEIERIVTGASVQADTPLVLKLSQVRKGDAWLVGGKMANLGEVQAHDLAPVPDGFVLTARAFNKFMQENGLWERALRLETVVEGGRWEAIESGCDEVMRAIEHAKLPDEIQKMIKQEIAISQDTGTWAVRSSAVGEDTMGVSHAGLYKTVLDVEAKDVRRAVLEVIKSAFTPPAVTYRFEHGLPARSFAMAVGVLRMIQWKKIGVLFTRVPERPHEDAILLEVNSKRPSDRGEDHWEGEVKDAQPHFSCCPSLGGEEIEELISVGRSIEKHFGCPQDIEWAKDEDGKLFVLQTRPLFVSHSEKVSKITPSLQGKIIFSGGKTASSGIGGGIVLHLEMGKAVSSEALARKTNLVLVMRFPTREIVRFMPCLKAIVAESGSITGHTAILAREAKCPMIVSAKGAMEVLKEGMEVTVDADTCCVYAGLLSPPQTERTASSESPAINLVRSLALNLVPLNLFDSTSKDFTPENAKTLHDITRYVHEKAFEEMFYFAERVKDVRGLKFFRLKANLPLEIKIFDVGGGIEAKESRKALEILPEDVVSKPLRPFLQGMLRVSWQDLRPISPQGFLSVVGQAIASPPAEVSLGGSSYAIVSSEYMNFSTKAGYHFSTVDSWCGQRTNKNYVHFRFKGGAADPQRRARRVVFLRTVLDKLGFLTSAKGDLLTARMEKRQEEEMLECLQYLGRLVMCARQLDMLMDDNESPHIYAEAFLSGKMDKL